MASRTAGQQPDPDRPEFWSDLALLTIYLTAEGVSGTAPQGAPARKPTAGKPSVEVVAAWRRCLKVAKADASVMTEMPVQVEAPSSPAELADGWIRAELRVLASLGRTTAGSPDSASHGARLAAALAAEPRISSSNWSAEFGPARSRVRSAHRRVFESLPRDDDPSHAASPDDAILRGLEDADLQPVLRRAAEVGLPLAREYRARALIQSFVREVPAGTDQNKVRKHRPALKLLGKAFDLRGLKKVSKGHDLEGESRFRLSWARLACRNLGARTRLFDMWQPLRERVAAVPQAVRPLWAELVAAAWHRGEQAWIEKLRDVDLVLLLDQGDRAGEGWMVEAIKRTLEAGLTAGGRLSEEAAKGLGALHSASPSVREWVGNVMLKYAPVEGPVGGGELDRAAVLSAGDLLPSERLILLVHAARTSSLEELVRPEALEFFRAPDAGAGALALAQALGRWQQESRRRHADALTHGASAMESAARGLEGELVLLGHEAPWLPPGAQEPGRRALVEFREEAARIKERLGRAGGELSHPTDMLELVASEDVGLDSALRELAFDPHRPESATRRLQQRAFSGLLGLANSPERVADLLEAREGWPPEAWPVLWQAAVRVGQALDQIFESTQGLLERHAWARDAWVAGLVAVSASLPSPPSFGEALASNTVSELHRRLHLLSRDLAVASPPVGMDERVREVERRLLAEVQEGLRPLLDWLNVLRARVDDGSQARS